MDIQSLKIELDAIKFVMRNTSDPYEKIGLATIGMEKNNQLLVKLGYKIFNKEDHARQVTEVVTMLNKPQQKKNRRKKKKPSKKGKGLFWKKPESLTIAGIKIY